MAEAWAESWPPKLRALRPEQLGRLQGGDLKIRTNQRGAYVVNRARDGQVGIGATPRLAIEDLK